MTLYEAGAVVAIGLTGLGLALAFWTDRPLGAALAAAPLGVAAYAIAGLVLTAVDQFSTVRSIALAGAFSLSVLVWRRVVKGAAATRLVVHATLEFLAVAVVILIASIVAKATRITPDSIDYLGQAGSLERFGELLNHPGNRIEKRLFVVPVLETIGVGSGRGYVSSLITLTVASGTAFMVWLSSRIMSVFGIRRDRMLLSASIVTVFVVTTNRVVYHHFYINGHGVFAALLVVGIGLAWYARIHGEWGLAPLMGLSLAAIVPLRAEGLVVVIFFVLPVLASRATPRSARWWIALPVAALAALWNLGVLIDVLASTSALAPWAPVATAALGLGLLAVVVVASWERFDRLSPYIPVIALSVLLAVVAAAAVHNLEFFTDSAAAIAANIATAGLWAAFWWIAPIALVVCILVVRLPSQGTVLWGLASFPALTIAAAYLRHGRYRLGPGDSANRMLMHVVFLVGLYLIVALGVIANEVDDDEARPTSIVRRLFRAVAVGD